MYYYILSLSHGFYDNDLSYLCLLKQDLKQLLKSAPKRSIIRKFVIEWVKEKNKELI